MSQPTKDVSEEEAGALKEYSNEPVATGPSGGWSPKCSSGTAQKSGFKGLWRLWKETYVFLSTMEIIGGF